MRNLDELDKSVDDLNHRCGRVALLGRPNVGKSTLINRLTGFKVSIVSPKPQTTRHAIIGIVTHEAAQIIYVDTPGLHHACKQALNRQLNRLARQTISDVDVLVHVIEAGQWRQQDENVWNALAETECPRLLVINKIDLLKDKKTFLPFLEKINNSFSYTDVYLVSARRSDGLQDLEQGIIKRLPIAPALYAADEITDRSQRFLVAELVREQLMRQLQQELPYATTVEVEQYAVDGKLLRIGAVIWVEREAQKAIVIGSAGEQLKSIGTAARREIEKLVQTRVFLGLWVRVRKSWADDESALQQFGYND